MPFALESAPITPGRAVGIADDFISAQAQRAAPHRRARRGFRPASTPSGKTRTCSEDGTNLLHLVSLDGGGFVAVAADDAAQHPVLGFSTSGELPDGDIHNPFWALVGAEAQKRGGARQRRRQRRFQFSDSHPGRRRSRAAASASATLKSASATTVEDIRVAPLVKSRWNQKTVGSKKVYNYYTPSGYCCGCVATAMSQLMRFHGFPSASVTPRTFTCYVGAGQVETNMTMVGGIYDWASMPLVPTSSISDAQREMIGRICFDAGVSVRMAYGYSGDESGAFGGFEHDPLKSVFGYASAESCISASGTLSDAEIKSAILANLDAGFPVLLGILHLSQTGTASNGHAILADGYGYIGETLYCHLNMGWSGSYDYWYALPDIGAGHRFNAVDTVTYNIFPNRTGQLVTGHVTDPFGNPMEGVTVNATIRRSQFLSTSASATTDENGIYAIFAPAGRDCTETLSVTYSGWTSASLSTSTCASKSPSNINWDTGDYSYDASTGLRVGNSWGNDFTVGNTNGTAAAIGSLTPDAGGSQTGTTALSLSLSGTVGAWYDVERTFSLESPQWKVVESFMIPTSGAMSVDLPTDGSDSAFYRIVPK